MDEELMADFTAGVNAYYGGEVPGEDWQAVDAWHNPFVAGWLLASHADLGIEYFSEE